MHRVQKEFATGEYQNNTVFRNISEQAIFALTAFPFVWKWTYPCLILATDPDHVQPDVRYYKASIPRSGSQPPRELQAIIRFDALVNKGRAELSRCFRKCSSWATRCTLNRLDEWECSLGPA